jgi:DNA-binding NarL/FixJ family response regulator
VGQIQIILVGENLLARAGVAAIVARQPDLRVVAEARTCSDVARLGDRVHRDLYILDVPTVGPDVVEVARQLTGLSRGVSPPVLIVASSSTDHLYDLLRIGSCTLISRSSGSAELTACIRLVAAGYVVVERRHAGRLASGVRRFSTADDLVGHRAQELTSREREVFALMAQGHSNNEIARVLAVANSTIKSHVKEIYQKLGLKNRVEVALYGAGDLLLPDDQALLPPPPTDALIAHPTVE